MVKSVKSVVLMMLLSGISAHGAVSNRGAIISVGSGSHFRVHGLYSLGTFHNKSLDLLDGVVRLDGTMTVQGDVMNTALSGGTFHDSSTGVVVLDGRNQTIRGPHRFPDLKKEVSRSDTLTFYEGSRNCTVISGTLILRGTELGLLVLQGNSGKSDWEIDPQGGYDLEYIEVGDSNNVSGSVIDVSGKNCYNAGNNTNWIFTYEPTYTVRFSAGANGALSGNITQILVTGGTTRPVHAVPLPGYHFVQWTRDGILYSKQNPLVVPNVANDMGLTAVFAYNPAGTYEVRFSVDSHGALSGESAQFVAGGAGCTPVQAVPNPGYRFDSWSGDYEGTENPLVLTDVGENMSVVANFIPNPPGVYSVTFISAGNGTILGGTNQIVAAGTDCTPVEAIPNPGYRFDFWRGDYAGTENPLTLTGIDADTLVEARFSVPPNSVTQGMIISLLPGDIEGYTISDFLSNPSVSALFIDPVRKVEIRAKLKNANRATKWIPSPVADLEWTRKVALLDKRQWLRTESCQETIRRLFPLTGRIAPVPCALKTRIKFIDEEGETIVLTDAESGEARIVSPVLLRVLDSSGAVTIEAGTGESVTLVGMFFGTRPPKAWLEHTDPRSGQVRRLALRTVLPHTYPDYRGTPHKSCMNPFNGESSLTVSTPPRWPANWDHWDDHPIVIDNGFGRATIPFRTRP